LYTEWRVREITIGGEGRGRRERRREYFNWCKVSCNTEGSPLPKWRVRGMTIGGEGRGRRERRNGG
jgi:hypothetical protein